MREKAAHGWGPISCGYRLELDSDGGEELLDVGPDGLEVVDGLDVERDVERVDGCGGDVGDRRFDLTEESAESGDDGGCNGERFAGSGEPLEGVLRSDFDAFFNADEDVCHDEDSSFRPGAESGGGLMRRDYEFVRRASPMTRGCGHRVAAAEPKTERPRTQVSVPHEEAFQGLNFLAYF